jgi:hypothetical protein
LQAPRSASCTGWCGGRCVIALQLAASDAYELVAVPLQSWHFITADIYDGAAWTEMDIDDLKAAIAHGSSIEDAAESWPHGSNAFLAMPAR